MEEVLGDVEAVKEVAGLDEAAVLVAADAAENECLLFLSMAERTTNTRGENHETFLLWGCGKKGSKPGEERFCI